MPKEKQSSTSSETKRTKAPAEPDATNIKHVEIFSDRMTSVLQTGAMGFLAAGAYDLIRTAIQKKGYGHHKFPFHVPHLHYDQNLYQIFIHFGRYRQNNKSAYDRALITCDALLQLRVRLFSTDSSKIVPQHTHVSFSVANIQSVIKDISSLAYHTAMVSPKDHAAMQTEMKLFNHSLQNLNHAIKVAFETSIPDL